MSVLAKKNKRLVASLERGMQVLQPHERELMPVTSYVDPAIIHDEYANYVKVITHSYAFHVTDVPRDELEAFRSADQTDKLSRNRGNQIWPM